MIFFSLTGFQSWVVPLGEVRLPAPSCLFSGAHQGAARSHHQNSAPSLQGYGVQQRDGRVGLLASHASVSRFGD